MFMCSCCDRTFSGREPYNAHLNSIKHKKNAHEPIDPVMKKEFLPQENQYNCTICRKSFSGPSSQDEHFKGRSHFKKLQSETFVKTTDQICDIMAADKKNANIAKIKQPTETKVPPPEVKTVFPASKSHMEVTESSESSLNQARANIPKIDQPSINSQFPIYQKGREYAEPCVYNSFVVFMPKAPITFID